MEPRPLSSAKAVTARANMINKQSMAEISFFNNADTQSFHCLHNISAVFLVKLLQCFLFITNQRKIIIQAIKRSILCRAGKELIRTFIKKRVKTLDM